MNHLTNGQFYTSLQPSVCAHAYDHSPCIKVPNNASVLTAYGALLRPPLKLSPNRVFLFTSKQASRYVWKACFPAASATHNVPAVLEVNGALGPKVFRMTVNILSKIGRTHVSSNACHLGWPGSRAAPKVNKQRWAKPIRFLCSLATHHCK